MTGHPSDDPGPGDNGRFPASLTALGRLLYEEMERLAPTAEIADWNALEDWERDLLVLGVRRLIRERALITKALADDDNVLW